MVDYQGLAKELRENLEPGDVIFVRTKDWRTTPVFYYLEGAPFVASNYREALAESPNARVWLITFANHQPTQDMMDALQSYEVTKTLTGVLSASFLYQRKELIHDQPTADQ